MLSYLIAVGATFGRVEPLLAAYEAEGATWIGLDEAMRDPIYSDLPIAQGVTQGTLIDEMVDARSADHPPWPEHPDLMLAALCPGSVDDPGP